MNILLPFQRAAWVANGGRSLVVGTTLEGCKRMLAKHGFVQPIDETTKAVILPTGAKAHTLQTEDLPLGYAGYLDFAL